MKTNFVQALDVVAKRKGFASWAYMMGDPGFRFDSLEIWEDTAKLMAQDWANEAVKADRENREGYYEEYMSRELIIRHWDLNNRPLPYPEQP